MNPPSLAQPVRITVDLEALAANYAQLRHRAAPAEVAAVVKANAYGLGVGPVASRLARDGCHSFFAGTVSEGLELRRVLRHARVFVLNELPAGGAPQYTRDQLVPVLNTLDEVRAWATQGAAAPAALQIDTGMTRAGLSAADVAQLAADSQLRAALNVVLVMSHLACADEATHPLNRQQLERFGHLRRHWPGIPWSIANSAGIFLGPDFHGDLVRPGIALYGGRPGASGANPMRAVVKLESRVLQVRAIADRVTVGYGAAQALTPPARIATAGIGYADGYPRSLSGHGSALWRGRRARIAGRVSMDLLTLDVSDSGFADLTAGEWVTLIGDGLTLEEVASAGSTVNYELLTSLSRRADRVYR
ncbi:MAG: alanine racemase [Gammaproteobacteria bacterium]|nr:alanine racemase [Gammaproteobacteria bacterium]